MTDGWDEYLKKQALEKHEERLWSEIEDGLATKKPVPLDVDKPQDQSSELFKAMQKAWDSIKDIRAKYGM